jgi:hypothetical protein
VAGLVRALPDPDVGTVAVLGADDFSIKRGRNYVPLLIDAVTYRRVEVLPDGKTETVVVWLREHPGVRPDDPVTGFETVPRRVR